MTELQSTGTMKRELLAFLLGSVVGSALLLAYEHNSQNNTERLFKRKQECSRLANERRQQFEEVGDIIDEVIYSPSRNSCVVRLYSTMMDTGQRYEIRDLVTNEYIQSESCTHPKCGGGVNVKINDETESALQTLAKP